MIFRSRWSIISTFFKWSDSSKTKKSNGPNEAINGRLEHLRGSALGFRNLSHYIARRLLEAGGFRPDYTLVQARKGVRLQPPLTVLTENGHPVLGGHFTEEVRRCPTLPQGPPCSTIGAVRLSFRVRNVTGRFPHAMAAETLLMFQSVHNTSVVGFSTVHREPLSGRKHRSDPNEKCYQVIGLLVPVSFTRYRASTSGLSTQ